MRVRGDQNVIVHLLEYKVVPGHEAELAGHLRHVSLAAPPSHGQIARYVGRRLGHQGREHLAVTTWSDSSALGHGTDAAGIPAYLAPVAHLLGDKAARQYRVVASIELGGEPACVLRVYRTSVATEAVEIWERRTLESVGRLANMEGLLAVIAGVEVSGTEAGSQASIVVLTVWMNWDLLLAATGGRLNRAIIDTELADIEGPATADHFELLEAEPGPG
jgi:hypothetical protein